MRPSFITPPPPRGKEWDPSLESLLLGEGEVTAVHERSR